MIVVCEHERGVRRSLSSMAVRWMYSWMGSHPASQELRAVLDVLPVDGDAGNGTTVEDRRAGWPEALPPTGVHHTRALWYVRTV